MTKEQFKHYQREYRKRLRSHCECGNKATVKRDHGGAVCERCDRLEKAREQRELRRARTRARYGYKYGGLTEHKLHEDQRH